MGGGRAVAGATLSCHAAISVLGVQISGPLAGYIGKACTDFRGIIRFRRQRNHAEKTVGEPCAGKSLAQFESGMGRRASRAGTAPLTTDGW
jgi:hypothetical protein